MSANAKQIEETDANGVAVTRYTQGLGIDEPLALHRGGATYYYQADGLGSTVLRGACRTRRPCG